MTKPTKKPAAPPIDRLKEVALECHEKSGGNHANARNLFLKAVHADPELQWQAFEPWHERAAQMWINFATGQTTPAPATIVPNSPRNVAGMAAASAVASKSILDRIIVNGQPIGDLTAQEAGEWASARTRDVRWIASLINGIPPKSRIRDCVSAEEAQKLWDAAEKARGEAS